MPNGMAEQHEALLESGALSPVSSASSAASVPYEYRMLSGVGVDDWMKNEDHFAHNEAIAAYLREAASAREARQYQADREDSAFSRKVADVTAAGFSPLAALDAQGFSVGSVPTASSSAATKGGNSISGLITGLVAAIALIASKGISAAASSGAAAAKASAASAAFAKSLGGSMTKAEAIKILSSGFIR